MSVEENPEILIWLFFHIFSTGYTQKTELFQYKSFRYFRRGTPAKSAGQNCGGKPLPELYCRGSPPAMNHCAHLNLTASVNTALWHLKLDHRF